MKKPAAQLTLDRRDVVGSTGKTGEAHRLRPFASRSASALQLQFAHASIWEGVKRRWGTSIGFSGSRASEQLAYVVNSGGGERGEGVQRVPQSRGEICHHFGKLSLPDLSRGSHRH
jgi:hypothetical protein